MRPLSLPCQDPEASRPRRLPQAEDDGAAGAGSR